MKNQVKNPAKSGAVSPKKVASIIKKTSRGESPVVWLTRGYIVALLIIALLTALSHFVSAQMTENQIMSAEVSYNLSQEINLIGQIERTATTFYASKEEFDKMALVQQLDELKNVHGRVQSYLAGSAGAGDAKNALAGVMLQEPFQLDAKIGAFIQNAGFFLTYDRMSETEDRKTALAKITQNVQKSLVKPLQFSLEDYQENQIQEARYVQGIKFYMTIGILVVILLEALLIFMPLVRKVQKYSDILKRQAMEDTLTGLKNRRALTKEFEVIQKIAHREKKNFVLAICDLDKFKSVNDTYGHDVGDLVLKHFAGILEKALRPSDVIARMGGEEFVVVLNKTTAEEGKIVLERVRKMTEETACKYNAGGEQGKLNYTTSIGFTVGPFDAEATLEQYFKKADEGLYKAKNEGRNRVICAQERADEKVA